MKAGVSKKLARIVFCGLLFCSVSGTVHAVEPGGYLGFSIGSADDDVLDESDTGYKILGGFNANNNIGFEIAFVDLGSYVNDLLDQYGVAFEVVGYLPVANNFDLFGKLGIFSWTVEVGAADDDGTDLTYGFGGAFRASPQISVRAEWERFTDISGGDVDLLSAGVTYHF